MFELITKDNVSKLKIGEFITKYPLSGDTTETVDVTNQKQINIMKIYKIDGNRIELTFDSDQPVFLNLMKVEVGVLHKTLKEIVEDKRWWRQIN